MKLLIRFFLTALWILLLSNVLTGIHVSNFWTALGAAFILSVLNTVVKPVLQVLTFPLSIFTLGLWLFFLNVGMIYLTAYFLDGFNINSFISALFFSVLLSVGTSIIGAITKDSKEKEDKK